jgi:hypothetical protein
MKKVVFCLAAALLAAPVYADDLLDEVLRRDVRSPKPEAPVSASGSSVGGMPLQEQWTPEKGLNDSFQDGRPYMDDAMEAGRKYRLKMESEKGEKTTYNEDDGRSAAGMEKSARLSLRGGGGSEGAIVVAGELTVPLWKSAFDVSFRGFYDRVDYIMKGTYQNTYYTHYYTYTYSFRYGWRTHSHTRRHTETVHYKDDALVENYGGEIIALWRPFRGRIFSPYAGVGGRYEIGRFDDKHSYDGLYDYGYDDEFGLAWRVGGTLNLGRFWLNGEYDGGMNCNELAGTVGWRCGRHIALHALVEWFQGSGNDGKNHDGTAFGGGVTWVF